MKITIFADASFCHETGAGGWGGWAKRDDWERGRFLGGRLDCPLKSSTTAELCAIACAVWGFTNGGPDLQHVMIQCDNTSALGLVRIVLPQARVTGSGDKADQQWLAPVKPGAYEKLTDVEKDALEVLRSSIRAPTAVSLRHVKGHGDSLTGRSWVNEQCDAEAYRNMVSMRKQLRKAQRKQEA